MLKNDGPLMCIAMSLDWESTTQTEIIKCNIIMNEES